MTLFDIPRVANWQMLTVHQRRNLLAMRHPDMSLARREQLARGIQAIRKDEEDELRRQRRLERNRAYHHRTKVLKREKPLAKATDEQLIAAYLAAPSMGQAAKALGVGSTFAKIHLRRLIAEGRVERKRRTQADPKRPKEAKRQHHEPRPRGVSDEVIIATFKASKNAYQASAKLGLALNAVGKRLRRMRSKGIEI